MPAINSYMHLINMYMYCITYYLFINKFGSTLIIVNIYFESLKLFYIFAEIHLIYSDMQPITFDM